MHFFHEAMSYSGACCADLLIQSIPIKHKWNIIFSTLFIVFLLLTDCSPVVLLFQAVLFMLKWSAWIKTALTSRNTTFRCHHDPISPRGSMISSYRIWNTLLLICLCRLWLNPASFMGLSSWRPWKNSGHLIHVLSRISNVRYIKARQLKEDLSKLNALWDRPAGTSVEQRADSHMNMSSFGYLLMWTTVMKKTYTYKLLVKLVRISQKQT